MNSPRSPGVGAVTEIEIVQGDITLQRVGVIVNAANHSLFGGGGVDGAIHRAGGPDILAACKALRAGRFPDGLPTGQAVATTAGTLEADYVVHTSGPVYVKTIDHSDQLASAYRESMRVASGLRATSVAFPAISAGVYGWPMDDAAHIAIETVRGVIASGEAGSIELVRFVLLNAAAFTAFTKAYSASAN